MHFESLSFDGVRRVGNSRVRTIFYAPLKGKDKRNKSKFLLCREFNALSISKAEYY